MHPEPVCCESDATKHSNGFESVVWPLWNRMFYLRIAAWSDDEAAFEENNELEVGLILLLMLWNPTWFERLLEHVDS